MPSSSPSIRLQKYIADCGVTSRRKAEEYILNGRVKVNGRLATVLGTKVDPRNDVVEVDGNVITHEAIDKLYLLVHKPRGYMTTVSDPEGRRTVMDLVKGITQRIFPVGRLDYYSEGLLLMTNDGEMANRIMHPKFNVSKVYEVKVFGAVSEKILRELKRERNFPEGKVRPQSVRVIQQLPKKTWLEFRLNEGRNREIRRICEECGLTVDKLKRVAIEGLSINGVAPGQFVLLTKQQLLKSLGMKEDGTKLPGQVAYRSPKKTIKLSRKGHQHDAALADDKGFRKFRRTQYVKTMESMKKAAEEKAALEKLQAQPSYQK